MKPSLSLRFLVIVFLGLSFQPLEAVNSGVDQGGGGQNRADQSNAKSLEDFKKQKEDLKAQEEKMLETMRDENGCFKGLAGAECRKAFNEEKKSKLDASDNAEMMRRAGKRQIQMGEGQKKLGVITMALGIGCMALCPGQGAVVSGLMLVLKGFQMMQEGQQTITQGMGVYDDAKKFEYLINAESALDADALNKDPKEYCLPYQKAYKEPWCQLAAAQGLLANKMALQANPYQKGSMALAVPGTTGAKKNYGIPSEGGNAISVQKAASVMERVAQKIPSIPQAFAKGLSGVDAAREIAGEKGVEAYNMWQGLGPIERQRIMDQAAGLAPNLLGISLSSDDIGNITGKSGEKEGAADEGFKMVSDNSGSSGGNFRVSGSETTLAAVQKKDDPLGIFGKKDDGSNVAFKKLEVDESKNALLAMADAQDNLFYLIEVRYSIKAPEFKDLSELMSKEDDVKRAAMLKAKRSMASEKQ